MPDHPPPPTSTTTSDYLLDRPGISTEFRALRGELVGWAREIVPVLAANAARTDGEVVDQGLVLTPMSDLPIDDTWFVAGMRGTGSNTLVATDVFVPDQWVISLPAAIGGRYGTASVTA